VRWWASGAALAVEGSAAAIAFDVHLQDGGVMHEAVDGRERMAWSGNTLPHSPNGWLAVISSEWRIRPKPACCSN
jgi:hypothetical protein